MPPHASWMPTPVVLEGGTAAAAAAGHKQIASEPRASRAEGSPHTGVWESCTGRRISSVSPTSRVAHLLEAIAVDDEAVALSRLRLHLALASRIDLLLRKGRRERT